MQKRTGIVGLEPEHEVPIGSHHDGVASHGVRGQCLVVHVVSGFLFAAGNSLESMPVQMEGMFPRIHVVQYDFDHLIFLQYEWIGVIAVDGRICREIARSESGVEGIDLWADVCDVVEPRVVGAITKVVHLHMKLERVIGICIEGKLVIGNKGEVVERFELVDEGGRRSRCRIGVNEPASDVGVKVGRNSVEKIFIHASNNRKVGGSIVLCGNQDAVALSSGQIDHVGFSGLGVNAVDFHDLHRMAFEPEILPGESSHVDDAEHISLTWLNLDVQILSVIHQGRLGDRLSTSWIGVAYEAGKLTRHLVVIPVRQSQNELFIILVLVWRVRILDDQCTTKAIWILARIMRMIPVGSRLVDLVALSKRLRQRGRLDLHGSHTRTILPAVSHTGSR